METRVRQEKEAKTQKGHRGERRNMFFRNSVKDFERTSKRCESLYFLIIVFLFFVSYETESLRLAPSWLHKSAGRALHRFLKGHGLELRSA